MVYESKRIARWWNTRVEKDGDAHDRIIITYANSNVIDFYSFKRTKVGCFDPEEYEYTIKYVPAVEFIRLFRKLNKYASRYYTKRRAA
jgi:hypothetical protein